MKTLLITIACFTSIVGMGQHFKKTVAPDKSLTVTNQAPAPFVFLSITGYSWTDEKEVIVRFDSTEVRFVTKDVYNVLLWSKQLRRRKMSLYNFLDSVEVEVNKHGKP